jgi:hypothetical protein
MRKISLTKAIKLHREATNALIQGDVDPEWYNFGTALELLEFSINLTEVEDLKNIYIPLRYLSLLELLTDYEDD